ncbi:MAG TPA: metallophosphoesterase [Rhizomicrobium sp.]|nr:metallophosphoesterase [Rhizomicrobium sp.]
MTKTIAVLSDLHANVHALRAALQVVEARNVGSLVIMGDLLTYGCDPHETLALVREAAARWPTTLLSGNHDQLYFDLAGGDVAYYARLPEWLRESVDWTRQALDGLDLKKAFDWCEELVTGEILFAHANPFRYGDWTYLNSDAELGAAQVVLARRGFAAGIFGHTHRAKIVEYDRGAELPRGTSFELAAQQNVSRSIDFAHHHVIANAGSLGQPRNIDKTSSLMFIDPAAGGAAITLVKVEYDVAAHTGAIRQSSMSENTKQKLSSYFA